MCFNGSSVVHSCYGRCGQAALPLPIICQCDKMCLHYGDCCLDYEQECLSTASHPSSRGIFMPLDGDIISSEDSEWSLDDDGFQASDDSLEVTFTDSDIIGIPNKEFNLTMRLHAWTFEKKSCTKTSDVDFFLLTSRCLNQSYSGTSVEYLCQFQDENDVLSSLPVTARGKHYRNIYCAFCSGVEFRDIRLWRVSLFCRNTEILEWGVLHGNLFSALLAMFDLCRIQISPSTGPGTSPPRRCAQDAIDVCDPGKGITGSSADLCGTYSSPARVNGRWYKNAHCAYCNAEFGNTSSISCDGFQDAFKLNFLPRPVGLPLLFDFSGSGGGIVSHKSSMLFTSETPNCTSNGWFDPLIAKCRESFCPKYHEFRNGTCVKSDDECVPTNKTWNQAYRKQMRKPNVIRQIKSCIRIKAVSADLPALGMLIDTFHNALNNKNDGVRVEGFETVSKTRNSTIKEHSVLFQIRQTNNGTWPSDLPSRLRGAFRSLNSNNSIKVNGVIVEWQSFESLNTLTEVCDLSAGKVFVREIWNRDTSSDTDVQYNRLLEYAKMFDRYIPQNLRIYLDEQYNEKSRLDFYCCKIKYVMPDVFFQHFGICLGTWKNAA